MTTLSFVKVALFDARLINPANQDRPNPAQTRPKIGQDPSSLRRVTGLNIPPLSVLGGIGLKAYVSKSSYISRFATLVPLPNTGLDLSVDFHKFTLRRGRAPNWALINTQTLYNTAL